MVGEQSSPSVYERRVNLLVLVGSLSAHRHPYIGFICNSPSIASYVINKVQMLTSRYRRFHKTCQHGVFSFPLVPFLFSYILSYYSVIFISYSIRLSFVLDKAHFNVTIFVCFFYRNSSRTAGCALLVLALAK